MTRILAVADEVVPSFFGDRLIDLDIDLIVACGDLPFDYLEYLREVSEVPLLYVPGNHDPSPIHRPITRLLPATFGPAEAERPHRCTNLDGRVEDELGLRIAGLGGSIRYNLGAHQYTQTEMRRRARRLAKTAGRRRLRDGRSTDILITHSPPLDCGDGPDGPHNGFSAFHTLISSLQPTMMLHGHIHPYGQQMPDRVLGATKIINVIPFRLIEID